MRSAEVLNPSSAARRFLLRGNVQGFGVRPAVYRLATGLGLAGYVRNTAAGVEVHVEGPDHAIHQFATDLPQAMPKQASLEQIVAASVSSAETHQFEILPEKDTGPLATRVPLDLALCSDCGREILNSDDRRFRYPFTSCARCGPRYTIAREMPYERSETSMATFELCSPCRAEYSHPRNVRFHAQTIACEHCGPKVWAVDAQGRGQGEGESALRVALQALRAGQIVAIQGIGGYQLLVDATSETAVRRLRSLKNRPTKPLAVMVVSLAAAQALAELEAVSQEQLRGQANPIVLVELRSQTVLCESIAPGLRSVGLMLPTTPLHLMLAKDFAAPLVCTSANAEGAPLAYRGDEVATRLAGLYDVCLHHDRAIERPIDDSVVRVVANRPVAIRLARGLAPRTLEIPMSLPLLALGGHMKSAAAWSNGSYATLGPHVGELKSLATRERLMEQLDAWQGLYRFRPHYLAHDLHPDYFTTLWAEKQSGPSFPVQHHHAHVVAGMLEHGWLDRTVLGICWDGAGYGPDGSIWGGEFLLCSSRGYRRLARLRPFALPGGDACVRQPWRSALSLVHAIPDRAAVERFFGGLKLDTDWKRLLPFLQHPRLSPRASSGGRLFDAAAFLILGIQHADYEGQPAMMLEAIADRQAIGQYELTFTPGDEHRPGELDWRPLVASLLRDRGRDESPGKMAMRFHRALAEAIALVCRRFVAYPVVLAGGVFQNRLLAELVAEQFVGLSQPLGLPGMIPPGDGGLAAGQLAVAAATLAETH